MHSLNVNPGGYFKLYPSRCFKLLFLLVILLSLGVIYLLPYSFFWKLVLLMGVSAYLSIIYRRQSSLHLPDAITALRPLGRGVWALERNQGVSSAILRGDSTVTPWVSVLRFQLKGGRRRQSILSILVFRDSLETDHYRRLLVTIATDKNGG